MRLSSIKVQPISLYAEMLEKCCNFNDGEMLFIGIDSHLHYLQLKEGYVVLLNKKGEPLIYFWDVKSLHQLQNLYYILKGEELKVDIEGIDIVDG